MESTSSSLKEDCEEVTTEKVVDRNDSMDKELLEIQELDASIQCLQLKIEEISTELTDLQFKNREKLKQMLLSNPPECESLAKNTQLFLNLHLNESINDGEKNYNHADVLHSSAAELEEHSESDDGNKGFENVINDGSERTELTKNCPDEDYENCGNELNPSSIEGSPTEFIRE